MEPGFNSGTGSENPGKGAAVWDGRNAEGRTTGRGLYFVVVTDPAGGRKVLKLAVVR